MLATSYFLHDDHLLTMDKATVVQYLREANMSWRNHSNILLRRNCENHHTNVLSSQVANPLTSSQRIIFLTVTSLLVLISVVANMAAIYVATRMNHRMMYRNCVVSLAVSDLCMTVFTGTNNLFRFSQPWIDWGLGEFMCSLVPTVQTMCVLSNSITLTCVALDRYRSVASALQGRSEPSACFFAAAMSAIWLSALGISTPMFIAYYTVDLNVFTVNLTNIPSMIPLVAFMFIAIFTSTGISTPMFIAYNTVDLNVFTVNLTNIPSMIPLVAFNFIAIFTSTGISTPMFIAYNTVDLNVFTVNLTNIIIDCRSVDMCLTKVKRFNHVYYASVFTLIFLPLLVTFLALHAVIAVFIWQRRKPITPTEGASKTQSCEAVTWSEPEDTFSKRKPETPSIFKDTSQIAWKSETTPTTLAHSSVHTARKLKTLKIIIVVMLMFFTCRLPSWIFLLIVSSDSTAGVGQTGYLLQYSFSTLSLFNSAANPFLYGFLNEFLAIVKRICVWFRRLYCCEGAEIVD